MLIEDDTGFVLHARAYRETSLLVEVLSAQHGRIGLLARGVSTAKGQVLRAALQPLQWIRFSAQQRGELAQLRGAEALDAAPRLVGQAMLAGFYLSELTLRLAPRQDPLPGCTWPTARHVRGWPWAPAWPGPCVASNASCCPRWAWVSIWTAPAMASRSTRRRATNWILRRRAAAAERARRSGRRPLARRCWRWRPTKSPAADLASLRLPMRRVLAHHLGPRGLKSWEMLEQLAPRR